MQILQAALGIFAFWLILSMPVQPADLIRGLVVAGLMGAGAVTLHRRGGRPGIGLRRLVGLMLHAFDLIRTVVPAALQVARVLLDPSMPINPVVITHTTRLREDLERVALANTITLTPGTHCVDLIGDQLTVHCLDESFARDIIDGRVEARIARALAAARDPEPRR